MSRPVIMPSELSDHALAIYEKALRKQRTLQQGEIATPEDVAAAKEIAAAGLGSYRFFEYNGSHALWVTELASDFFTAGEPSEAEGLRVEVFVSPPSRRYLRDDGLMLACMDGAEIYRMDARGDAPWRPWRVVCRHATATDFEHDGVILGEIEVDDLTPELLGPVSSYFARIVSVRGWPFGSDPFAYEGDRDYAPGSSCDGECGLAPHPFGPYVPPERQELEKYAGWTARIVATPCGLPAPTTDEQ